MNYITFVGALCQSFTGPSSAICPGDDISFTCVVSSGATSWFIGDREEGDVCAYQSGSQAPDTCGPEGQFHSNHTKGSENYKNSSLRVDSITEDLNETRVECVDGISGDLIMAYDICIVGKFVQRRH